MAYSDDTPLSFLTVGDLKRIIADAIKPSEPRFVRGLAGLMELFACSHSQAVRIKASGVIDAAIRQNVAKGAFLVDADMALALFDRSKKIVDERSLPDARPKRFVENKRLL